MARTLLNGFETQSIVDKGYTAGDLSATAEFNGAGGSYDTGIFRSGAASLKFAAVSGSSGSRSNTVLGADLYHRAYIRVTARPASTTRCLLGTASAGNFNLALRADGKIEYRIATAVQGTSTTALTDTTKWYCVEWRVVAAGFTGDALRIDGAVEITGTIGALTGTTNFGPNDVVADTYTVYFDDVASDNATWPGEGKIVLLVPISDNADGSWTKPGGGTTVNATSVDNIPPIGIADTTSAANQENQIRNPTANDSYVANMTTYTDAGIGASDTITAIQPFAVVGAPTTTGAKTGSLQLTANPAEGGATAFGTTSNRYHAGTNAGTFKTGWAKVVTTTTSSPSVTLGNSPTLSLNITGGTASRIAMCCFMGVYVEYLPVVSAFAPPFRSKSIHNALVR